MKVQIEYSTFRGMDPIFAADMPELEISYTKMTDCGTFRCGDARVTFHHFTLENTRRSPKKASSSLMVRISSPRTCTSTASSRHRCSGAARPRGRELRLGPEPSPTAHRAATPWRCVPAPVPPTHTPPRNLHERLGRCLHPLSRLLVPSNRVLSTMVVSDTYFLLYISAVRELIDALNKESASGLIPHHALPFSP